ncbi:MAG: polysaccharide biosynthesis C-terminal domain-containing protein, partial [Lachnospiraceae bacterium]|nr:polysaccharide biosynthesis C-terminal domain-containing protein [Lachnospiraceae bacterium]
FTSFVRNDGNPSLAMAATLASRLFNIVFDYILMFPCGMGMAGAALATAISPVIGIAICTNHFWKKTNTIRIVPRKPSLRICLSDCKLGISAFIGELSSGVTTMVFNMLILAIAGNVGVAAYGVVANCSLVAVSIFNGVANGSQPLLSEFYGRGDNEAVKKVFKLSVGTAFAIALFTVLMIFVLAEPIVSVFNSEKSAELAAYGVLGMKLYFLGFLVAGINIAITGYFSATDQPKEAFVASISRGVVAIIVCAIVMTILFGMNGVWLSFGVAEVITLILISVFLSLGRNKIRNSSK